MVATLGCGGCDAEEKAGDPWALGDDMTMDAATDTSTGVDMDREPDLRAPDMVIDVGRPEDIGSPDIGIDAGDEVVTVVGWYTSAFEHSGFIEDPDGELNLGARPCSPYWPPVDDLEQWWVAGALDANPFVDAPDGTGARMRITGTLTPPGEHGHLGNYDRELVAQQVEQLSCETAALGGHCLRPQRGEQCVVPTINQPDASQKHELVVSSGGPSAQSIFELRLTFNEEVGDGRTDAVVRWRFDGDAPTDYAEAPDLAGLQLIQEQHGIFFNEIEYTNLDGWVLYSQGGADGWYVSISGDHPDGGRPMHVWGWFDVTDTIALP